MKADDENGPRPSELVVDGSASAVGAAIGLIGGPVGAVVGAVLGTGLSYVGRVALQWIGRRQQEVLQPAAEAVGGHDELGSRLEARSELMPLVLQTVNASSECLYDTHVRAMAAVLRDAVTDAVATDHASELIQGLAALRPHSVLVLNHIYAAEPDEHGGFLESGICQALGIAVGRVRGALRSLEDVGAATMIGLTYDGDERWQGDAMGDELLSYLRSVTSTAER